MLMLRAIYYTIPLTVPSLFLPSSKFFFSFCGSGYVWVVARVLSCRGLQLLLLVLLPLFFLLLLLPPRPNPTRHTEPPTLSFPFFFFTIIAHKLQLQKHYPHGRFLSSFSCLFVCFFLSRVIRSLHFYFKRSSEIY